jgi:hypothetical protein
MKLPILSLPLCPFTIDYIQISMTETYLTFMNRASYI